MMSFEQAHKREIQVEVCDEVSSTNQVLKEKMIQGPVSGPQLLVATSQTAGHGKLDRPFYSAPGCGAYFTLGLPLASLPTDWQPQQLTVQAVVAAYQAVQQQFCPLTIKWVNDLYRNDRKVAGILAETVMDNQNQLRGIVIGWGINLSAPANWPPALQKTAGAISEKPVTDQRRYQLVDSVIEQFYQLTEQPWPQLLDTYRQHQYLAGQRLVIDNGQQSVEGMFDQITDQGFLRIQTGNGPRTFSSGTVRTIK